MYDYGSMQSFFQQLINQINWQNEKTSQLETVVEQLQKEMFLKQQEPFDQLDVRMQQFENEFTSKHQNPVHQLELTVQQLQHEISALKKQQPVVVEKMEYKFDQLKVEKLEGTLNIGVTPNSLGSIDGLTLNDKTIEDVPIQPHHSRFQQIKNEIDQYLKQGLPKEINIMEKRYRYKVNEEFRTFIIEDINKQIDQRIHHYLAEINAEARDDYSEPVEQIVIKKVKKDIRVGIQNYFIKLSKEEKNPS